MVQFCQLGILESVWGFGGRGSAGIRSVDENIKKVR